MVSPCKEQYESNEFDLYIQSGNQSQSNYRGIITNGYPVAGGVVYNNGVFCFEFGLQVNIGQSYSLYIKTEDLLTLHNTLVYRISDWCDSVLSIYDYKVATYYFTKLLNDFILETKLEKTKLEFKNDCEK